MDEVKKDVFEKIRDHWPLLILVVILAVGAYLRLEGLDWDDNSHPHPDERFLTMVETSLQIPTSISEYFDTQRSGLNPHNVGHTFFVYGTFPIFIVRYLGEWLQKTGYDEIHLVGRAASAAFDILSILLVYLIAARLYRKRVGLLAAAFASLSVLLIQHAHFFVVDSFANTFILFGFYFAVRVMEEGRFVDFALFGIALGMSVASKISAAPLAAVLVLAALIHLNRLPTSEEWKHGINQRIIEGVLGFFIKLWYLFVAAQEFLTEEDKEARRQILRVFAGLVVAAFLSLLTFRILQPYAFQGPSFFGIKLNDAWLANMAEIKRQQAGDADFPPALQWALRTPVFFALQNMVLWGMGAPLGVLVWVAFLWALIRTIRKHELNHALLVLWTGGIFLWQSTQFTPAMRYQIPVYPTLVILAAWALWEAWDLVSAWTHIKRRLWGRVIVGGAGTLILAYTAFWAFAFLNIYRQPHTQVAASRWIYRHIPGAINFVLSEEGEDFYEPGSVPSTVALIRDALPVIDVTYKPDSTAQLTAVVLERTNSGEAEGEYIAIQATVFDGSNAYHPMASADFEGSATSSEIVIDFGSGQFIELLSGSEYLIRLELLEGDRIGLQESIRLQLNREDGEVSEFVSLPKNFILAKDIPALVNMTSRVNGQAHALYLPYATVFAEDSTGMILQAEVYDPANSEVPLASSTYRLEAPGTEEMSIMLPLDRPVDLEEGHTYQIRLDLQEGLSLSLRGSVIVHESTWDLGLPMRIDGRDGFGGLYQGVTQELYWPDDQDDDGNGYSDKLERIVEMFSEGDYLVIATNRQYGTIPRVPTRYPLSTVYYRALFGCLAPESVTHCGAVAEPGEIQEELGLELVAVFESNPQLGPLEINDQGAEEAFTVYDHPKVLIFEKSEAYSADAVRDLLAQVDLSDIDHSPPGMLSPVPENLLLPVDRLEAQRTGGTWSELFDWESWLNRLEFLTVPMWWIVIGILGLLAFPITRVAFRGLYDSGYPLARIVGLVLLAWGTWIFSSFQIPFEKPLILAVLFVIILVSAVLAWRDRDELLAYFKEKKKEILWTEVLALAFFLLDLGIRLGNPDLWHPYKGGEKPMNFSYLNAVLKSSSFPPYDPWFAGGYINYYYYGYVIVGVPIKLLGIVPSTAYNLVLPTVFALLALSAYSVGSNLFARFRNADNLAWGLKIRHVGLIAALAMVILGNLGSARLVYDGFKEIGGWPGKEEAAFGSGITYAIRGAASYLTGDKTFPVRSDRWYWDPSRSIEPGPGEAGPITEFPFFTFLYADMHAHMISWPLTIVTLGWGLSWLLLARERKRLRKIDWILSLFIGALFLGALIPTNTWDFPTYWALAAVAVVAAAILRQQEFDWASSLEAILLVPGLLGLAYILYNPYHQWYTLGYTQPDLWSGSKTQLGDYFVAHGLFLFVILSWMVWETRQWMARTPISALNRLRYKLIGIIVLALVFIFIVIYLTVSGVQIALVALPILLLAGVLFLWAGLPVEKRAVLFLVGTGTALTLLVEFVVLAGDISRMNTVFKFYAQVWTLFSLSAAIAFAWLWMDSLHWGRNWRIGWTTFVMWLVFLAALFPITATPAKIQDRMSEEAPHSLDGMAFMESSVYYDIAGLMELKEDYEAIRWMQENIQGSPVIIEANTPEYRWGSRFTIYTGLPGVLGWNHHQRQQRGFGGNTSVTDRAYAISSFYTTQSIEEARNFIVEFDVQYIIVGRLEKQYYEIVEPCWEAPGGDKVSCDMAGRPMGMSEPEVDPSECEILDEDSDNPQLACPTYGLEKFEIMRDRGLLKEVYVSDETVIYEVVQ